MRVASIVSVTGLLAAVLAAVLGSGPAVADGGGGYVVPSSPSDTLKAPLEGRTGDPARGQAIVRDRAVGNCLICHAAPIPDEPFQGDLGPDLAGVGGRLSSGQIRLRLVDSRRVNPATLMPPYHRTEGLRRVAERFRGKPVLSAQEIEDVVAYLVSLQ